MIDAYKDLAAIFASHGFSLYLVGGTVRDYLLDISLTDLDAVSEATPDKIKEMFPLADYTFERFGSVKLHYQGYKFDITTLREEKGYKDYRHPGSIVFVDSLKKDVKRRDFTINALYMDKDLKVIDYVDGVKDLKEKRIAMIGDSKTRIQEDPLRIIRAMRFMTNLDFKLDNVLYISIKNNKELLKNITPAKIEMEIKKANNPEKLLKSLKDLDIMW